MNRIELAAVQATMDSRSELTPLTPLEPVSCAVNVWRAVTRFAGAERVWAEREFARAINQGTPDVNIGFHPEAAEVLRNSASSGASLFQLLNAVESGIA
jgi:hypothetical protein